MDKREILSRLKVLLKRNRLIRQQLNEVEAELEELLEYATNTK